MNLKEACELFLSYSRSSKNLSEHTLRAYEIDLNDLLNFLGSEKQLNQCNKQLPHAFLLQEPRRFCMAGCGDQT